MIKKLIQAEAVRLFIAVVICFGVCNIVAKWYGIMKFMEYSLIIWFGVLFIVSVADAIKPK